MILYDHTNKISGGDLRQIITLLGTSFPGNPEELEHHFRTEFENFTNLQWCIARHNNKIVGTLLLRPKIMNYRGAELSVCGMSYMAIEANFQRSEVTENFKKMLLDISASYDLALGFARKKMDGYWSKYGFVGVTDFGETKIQTRDINLFDPEFSVHIKNAETFDADAILEIYSQNNEQLVGNMLRDQQEFKYAISTPEHRGFFKCFTCSGIFCGYMIIKGESIIEVRIKREFYERTAFAIKKYFQQNRQKTISFKTHINDPFITYISQFSHQTETRFAFEGGHILRISDLEAFFTKITPMLSKRLKKINLSSLNLENEVIRMTFDGSVMKINLKDRSAVKALTKLAFGMTAMQDERWHLAFSHLHTQFPVFDEF